jgi:hypothetical protein
MSTYAKQQFDIYRLINPIFIISMIGLILAFSGITWLGIEYTASAQKAALYEGSWSNSNSSVLSKLQISHQGVILTVHGFYNNTDLGTNSGPFTGEPFSIELDSPGGFVYSLQLTLNNNQPNELKVNIIYTSSSTPATILLSKEGA